VQTFCNGYDVVFIGSCSPGWIAHQNRCYQFNTRYFLSWQQSMQFCRSQGGRMVESYGLVYHYIYDCFRGRCGHDRMVVRFTLFLCNQWLSPLTLWVGIPLMPRCTWYNIMWMTFLHVLQFPPPVQLATTI
jgi:hypothetical protein